MTNPTPADSELIERVLSNHFIESKDNLTIGEAEEKARRVIQADRDQAVRAALERVEADIHNQLGEDDAMQAVRTAVAAEKAKATE